MSKIGVSILKNDLDLQMTSKIYLKVKVMGIDKWPLLSLKSLVQSSFLQMAYFKGYLDLSIKMGHPVYC